MAKPIVVGNLEEYGILKFEDLTKQQQKQVFDNVAQDWKQFQKEGRPRYSLGGQLNKTYTLKDLFK